ncbi:MAG: hypothetical protein JEZ14_18785, partial [Marinilabiliaceae bacterium]|nr:hypothetical protein [Marinilabiliaceae bacterium]
MRDRYPTRQAIRSIVFFFLLFVGLIISGESVAQTNWYTLASGEWNDPDIWTLDPAGAVPVNPSGEYPDDPTDNIVILSGKTVTIPDGVAPYEAPLNDLDNLNCGILNVKGQLDIRTSQGHAFTEIRGSGRILLEGDNFPSGDATDFITEGEDEGTVVFYGNDFTLSSADTFYNLEVDMTSGQAVTMSADYTVNGNLLIKAGTLQLGDATSNKYTLTIDGNITLNSTTSLSVGTGVGISGTTSSDFHNIFCSGDILNNGSIRLTNQATPVYNVYATTGAAILTLQGTSDNNFTCNGTTDLYRLVINKGSDQTYQVYLSASAEGNFRLYGRNNASGASTKGLYLVSGTLKLGGSVFIPTLTEGGSDFVIPATSYLWVSGAGVKVYTTARSNAETLVGGVQGTGVDGTNTGSQSFSVYGKLRMTDGIFDTNSHGFVVWNTGNAIILIEGGTVNTPGLRSAGASTGKYSYIQSGGTVTMYGEIDSDGIENTSATFSIKGEDNVFMMTGGTLEIQDANYVTAAGKDRAFEVESADGNYSVTGGTLRLNRISGAGADFYLSSTAPIYNLEVAGAVSGTNVVFEQSLMAQNDVTINNNTTLNAAGNNLSIGGDLTNNGTYSTGTNTTLFVGANSSTVNGGTITFDFLELDKDNPSQTVTFGTGTISINDDLTLSSGTLDVGTADRDITGNIEIVSGNITGSQALVLNGTAQQTLKGKVGMEQEFGSINLDNSAVDLLLLSDVNVTDFTFTSGNVNLDSHNLTVSGSLTGFSSSNYFYSSGLSSDRGLTLGFSMNGAYSGETIVTFPVGIITKYSPAVVTLLPQTDYLKIRSTHYSTRPVNICK